MPDAEGQKQRVLEPLKLKLPMVVSCHVNVRTRNRSPARATSTFNLMLSLQMPSSSTRLHIHISDSKGNRIMALVNFCSNGGKDRWAMVHCGREKPLEGRRGRG